MSELYCRNCSKPLYGGLDTFGPVGQEVCFVCDIELSRAEPYSLEWYGLAPHYHDLTITGSHIGSTVFVPLPTEKNEYGWYVVEPGLFFLPDDETAGRLGLWQDTRPPTSRARAIVPTLFDAPDETGGSDVSAT
jgi:hypothetical protein